MSLFRASRGDYISHQRARRGLKMVVLLLILIAMIGVSWWVWQQRLAAQVSAAEQALQPWNDQYQQAITLAESNPVEAKLAWTNVVSGLEGLQVEFKDQKSGLKVVQQRLSEIKADTRFSARSAHLDELPIFYDLRLAVSDFITTAAASSDTVAVFFDQGSQSLVRLDLSSKQFQARQLQLSPSLRALNIDTDRGAVLVSSQLAQLGLANENFNAEPQVLQTTKDVFEQAQLVGTFGTSIYVLTPSQRQIYKFTPDGDTFTQSNWLRGAQNLPFDESNSWSIDGDIWWATKIGELYKLTSGRAEKMTITNLDPAFNSPLLLTTTEDLDKVYVLEPNQHRLVVMSKTGQVERVITSQSLASATQVLVSPSLQKILAVSGSVVFEMPLNP